MPYVPPHKRVSATAGGKKCMPESMSSSVVHVIQRPTIRRATERIHRLFVAADQSPLLQFETFTETSYEHLSDRSLHTVSLAQDQQDPDFVEELSRLNLINRSFSMITDRISSDFMISLDEVRSFMNGYPPNVIHPKMVVRIGRLLFHHRRISMPSALTREKFNAEYLESARDNKDVNVSTTFDTSLAAEYFQKLQTMELQKSSEIATKVRYTFAVRDNRQPPDYLIRCVCHPNEDEKSITLKKIKLNPLRQLVGDVLCMGKKQDLRIMMYTEQHLLDLPEEEQNALQTLAKAAVVDKSVKGGLHWELGRDSVGRHFTVHSAQYRKVTIVTGKKGRWKFQVASRDRLSYEVNLIPFNWKDVLSANDQAGSLDCLRALLDTGEKCIS